MQKVSDPKTNRRLTANAPDSEDESDGGDDDDDEEEEASSESGSEKADEYSKDVEDTLLKTGIELKRGKTMAMREVITTAKRVGIDNSKIREAEDRLEDHKKRQYREEVEGEIKTFVKSPDFNRIDRCAEMIDKAIGADVGEDALKPVKDQHYNLMMARPLEDEEKAEARALLKRSTRDIVKKATQGGEGMETVVLDMHEGTKIPTALKFDPPLAYIVVTKEGEYEERAPLSSVKAYRAMVAQNVSDAEGFESLSKKEKDAAVLVNYENEDGEGSWIFLANSVAEGELLVEALSLLQRTAPAV